MKILTVLLTVGGLAWAQPSQAPNPTKAPIQGQGASGPVYRISVVARTTKAINYNHRSGSTMIGFRGTALMPAARGEAKVESKQGVIKIDADMQKLGPATAFGPEYLTYVMWAITPEGRATNIGEVLLDGGKSKLDATTQLQSFGLVVTAEPYFAVTQPSDVVVMENFVRTDTTGTIEQLDAKYELLQRGQYVLNVNPSEIAVRRLDPKVPLDLYEARNAVQIARWTGAPLYAADTFLKATQGLENAEGFQKSNRGRKPIGTVAREAVQMAEDARIITVKKIDAERLAAERQAGADRELALENGRAAAQSQAERVSREAEGARIGAANEAERVKRDSDARIMASQVEATRLRDANEAQKAAAQRDADRLQRDNDAKTAATETEVDRLREANGAQVAAAQAEADRLKRDNDAKAAAMQMEADRLKQENGAQLAAAQTEADRRQRDNDAKAAATQTEVDRLREANGAQVAAAQIEADRRQRDNDAKAAAMQMEADRLKQENGAQLAAAQIEADRLKRDNDAKAAATQTEVDRLKEANSAQRAAAQTEADRLKRDNNAKMVASLTEADRLKQENDAQRAAAQTELDRVGADKKRLETERTALRAQLLLQFNAILQTRDTARGLIVNMSDVLFDTAKFSLKPAAREKLAKVAGIVAGHPGLTLVVEGYTDSVGGDEYNQQLSERRGGAVRDYLVSGGIAGSSVTSKGFGKTLPVASNDTAAGRQQNRRVELVISGEVIGVALGIPIASR